MSEQEEVYLQFEAFDFSSQDFQNGLENVFESYLDQVNEQNDGQINEIVTQIKADDKSRLSMQAKVFYFCSQTGNIMNIEDYEEWKANYKPPQVEEVKEDTEYSSNYQQIVQLILEGKEVPGIKQIPSTILEGQTSESTAQLRKKPWEINKETEEKEAEELLSKLESENNEKEKVTEEASEEEQPATANA